MQISNTKENKHFAAYLSLLSVFWRCFLIRATVLHTDLVAPYKNGLRLGGRLKIDPGSRSGVETRLHFTHRVNFQLPDTFG